MLNKVQFDNYVKLSNKLFENHHKLDELGINFDLIYDDFYYIMDLVIDSNFDEIGRNTYFLYRYENLREVKDVDGTTYSFNNLDDLWNFLVKHYNYEPTEEVSNIN